MLRGCGPVSVSSVLCGSLLCLTMKRCRVRKSHDTFTVTHTAIRIPHRENGRNQSGFSLISTRRGRGRESSRAVGGSSTLATSGRFSVNDRKSTPPPRRNVDRRNDPQTQTRRDLGRISDETECLHIGR